MRTPIYAGCPACGERRLVSGIDRPVACRGCKTTFVVHRGVSSSGPQNLRSRTLEDLSVGADRLSSSDLSRASLGILVVLALLGLVLLLMQVDLNALREPLRAFLK